MKSILGLMFVALSATSVAAADLWWAVALGYRTWPVGYGAAWNYPTEDEAIEAAKEACLKEGSGDSRYRCFVKETGKNSCFFVTRWDRHLSTPIQQGPRGVIGGEPYTVRGHGWSRPYPTRAAAEAAAREAIVNNPDNPHGSGFGIALLECSGAQ